MNPLWNFQRGSWRDGVDFLALPFGSDFAINNDVLYSGEISMSNPCPNPFSSGENSMSNSCPNPFSSGEKSTSNPWQNLCPNPSQHL